MSLFGLVPNWQALIVATILSTIFRILWYSRYLFGEAWMRSMGYTKHQMLGKKPKKIYLINFLGALVMCYVLSILIVAIDIRSIQSGIELAFLVWLGFFIASTLLNDILLEKKSLNLFLINAAYWLLNLLIASTILSVWR